MTHDRLRAPILTSWGLSSLILIVTCWATIRDGIYPDPDDIMRLLEVRDLLGGQSWWDVDQHRLASGAMHWSRLVDLPLAGVELIVRPFAGQAVAERVALVLVPLLTLLAVMALIALVTRRLLDEGRARFALLLVPLSIPLVYQLRPMRIDHHGWQIACALLALYAFIRPRADFRSGVVGGAAIAVLLTISLEGLPIAAALLGIVALGWAIDPSRRRQLIGATSASFGVAVTLQLLTRGPGFWTPACDAMAPVWLAALGIAAAGVLPTRSLGRATLYARIALLGAIGVAAIVTIFAVDPRCTKGPFDALDPLVRTLWYENVSEGLPVWDQVPVWVVMSVGLPIVGLYGSVRSLRAADEERRAAWWMMLGALIAAFALSLFVSRAAATANAFAVPGAAAVVVALLVRARRIRGWIPRLFGTAGVLLIAAPGVAAIPVLGMPRPDPLTADTGAPGQAAAMPCTSVADARALAMLPGATLFAPIDIAPDVIAATRHHAITSGHHRNAAAMRDVLSAFTGSPDHAQQVVRRYRADYVVGCPGYPETELYRRLAPDGFWSRLQRGERFAWLHPVVVPGSRVLAWRVVHPLPSAPARP